jgi:hypothetical protein
MSGYHPLNRWRYAMCYRLAKSSTLGRVLIHMSVRMRAALVSAALTLALAPVAEAGTTATASKAKAGKSHKSGGSSDARNTSRKLRSAITADGMFKHLQALQMIADENGGNRASGFQG